MRRIKLIAILGFISLILGGLSHLTGCSDAPESEEGESAPRVDAWEVEVPPTPETSPWASDTGKEESPDVGVQSEPRVLASEIAAALSAFQLADDVSGVWDVVMESTPVTVSIEMPGKEPHVISESFASFEDFVSCLSDSEECPAELEMALTLEDFGGLIHEGVRSCFEGCCNFTYGRVWQQGLTIREMCYDETHDDKLSVTELTLSMD